MGWWQTYDGTVIGDDLADMVGRHIDRLTSELFDKYPTISRAQILSTISFCGNYIRQLDKGEPTSDEKRLVVMTKEQCEEWRKEHKVPLDESIMVAPGTGLLNVKNPFSTGYIE